MAGDGKGVWRISSGLLMVSVVACLAATGCSDIHPAPNVEEGGLLESPTHEADALREDENREEGGGRGGLQ
jgi:hypothetical protein